MPARGAPAVPFRFAIVTLDAHLAGAFESARATLRRELPALELSLHVQADWEADPAALARARAAIASAHVIACAQLFTEEQAAPILDAVRARRADADAVFCALCAGELTRQTKLGRFSMLDDADRSPFSPLALLKKLRGGRADGRSSGERQMTMLRRLPALLRFVPGAAQDVRAYFLSIQYWLGGTDANLASLVRYHVDRYAAGERAAYRGALAVAEPEVHPEVGVWHPALPGRGLAEDASALPSPRGARGTVGVLVGRSYLLAGNTRHYAAVVGALEARGLRALPVFASALDARPALERHFGLRRDGDAWRLERPTIDALVNLTGFSLVGGPAYNDAPAAQAALAALDVPYLSLQTLEFQSVAEWRADPRGLNPLQATLQVAIPELDGAIAPAVYGGKGIGTADAPAAPSEPLPERVAAVADRVARLVRLRRTPRAERKLAIVLFNFPPNAGNTGSAAYLPSSRRCSGCSRRSRSRATPSTCRRASTSCARWCATATASATAPRPTCTPASRPTRSCGATRTCARSRRCGARRPAARCRTAAACSSWGRGSATSSSASSRRSAGRATRCACSSRAASPRRTPSRPSTAGCARTGAPTPSCTSARTAPSSSCPASRPGSPASAGPSG
jgi:magnesium chelatase subunit H